MSKIQIGELISGVFVLTFDLFCADQDDVQRRLLELSQRTGYEIIQKQGQRVFGPPPGWTDSGPERGSEVYCYRVPRDCFEVRTFHCFQIFRLSCFLVLDFLSKCHAVDVMIANFAHC